MITEQPNKKEKCIRCDTSQDTNILLDCSHTLCLVCLSYIAIKAESKLLAFPTSIQCTICNQKTTLKPHCVQQIKTTIEKVLVPQFHQTLAYSPSNSPYVNTLQRPIQQLPEFDSPERCFNQKLTGITTMNQSIDISLPIKSIPSHCSSPKTTSKQSTQCCKIHPFEEYMFACRDCENQFLCLKCFTDNHHQNHNIRSIKKTLQLYVEQAGFSRLEIGERAELFELAYRKLMNRKQLLNKRHLNSQQKISETFQEIIRRVQEKQQQTIKECTEYFKKLEAELESKISFFKTKMEDAQFSSSKIRNSNPDDNPLQFIRDCIELQKELQQKDDYALHVLIQTNSNNQLVCIQDQIILPLYQCIDKLSVSIGEPRQSIGGMKDLRMDTLPSFRTRSYQKPFRTQKTDPGEDESIKQSRMRFMNFEQTKSNVSPDHISQLFSRQLSCKNLYKDKEQFSITSNEFHQQSFVSSKQQSRDFKERKERKTAGGNFQIIQKQQKQKFSKGLLEKKLKKIISKK